MIKNNGHDSNKHWHKKCFKFLNITLEGRINFIFMTQYAFKPKYSFLWLSLAQGIRFIFVLVLYIGIRLSALKASFVLYHTQQGWCFQKFYKAKPSSVMHQENHFEFFFRNPAFGSSITSPAVWGITNNKKKLWTVQISKQCTFAIHAELHN